MKQIVVPSRVGNVFIDFFLVCFTF